MVQRLPDSAASPKTAGLPAAAARKRWDQMSGHPVFQREVSAQDAYQKFLKQLGSCNRRGGHQVDTYWTAGPTRYRRDRDGALMPAPVHNPDTVWRSRLRSQGYVPLPPTADDTQFRRLTPHVGSNAGPVGGGDPYATLCSVGTFDPHRLAGFDPLSQVPMRTYTPAKASPRDAASKKALGGRDLLPDGNPAGYLQQPPLMLTTLDALPKLTNSKEYADTDAAAPISVIRVRVAGVTGPDAVSRERVRQVAEQISRKTGLDVDITIGSSPAPTAVDLPAGRHGRPALALTENWVKKGVAVVILSAVDKKSLILFFLVLLVCALFVGNASAAAVRTRRSELGVLACLGWSRPRLFGVVLGELLVIGGVAGLVGFGIALPTGAALGLHVPLWRSLLAVPAAVLLTLAAGAVPAYLASRSDPMAAVRPVALTSRRLRVRGGVIGMGLLGLVRVPARTGLAAVSLAVGVAALTLLVAVTVAFHGVLVGSLLGDAVSVRVRGVDYVAVAATLLLSAVAVADVLYLNVRDRLAEFATLRATGWPERAMTRLVAAEGAGIGVVGSILGAAVGALATLGFVGHVNGLVLAVAAVAAGAGVFVAVGATVVPALSVRRMPTTRSLAEE